MPSNRFCDLGSLTKQFAGFVVEAQQLLDRRYVQDRMVLSAAARQLETVLGPSASSALLPARMLARHIEFKTHLTLERSRASAFALMAKPVNLGFRVSHESEESTESRLYMEFEQLPVPRR